MENILIIQAIQKTPRDLLNRIGLLDIKGSAIHENGEILD